MPDRKINSGIKSDKDNENIQAKKKKIIALANAACDRNDNALKNLGKH